MNEEVLMNYYAKYLKEIRKVTDSTVKHYQDALSYISNYLLQKRKIQRTIYEIQEIGELEIIKEELYANPDFIALDSRGHRMYSAGLNNYYRFATGEGFANLHDRIRVMDTEVPLADKETSIRKLWKRSLIIKTQAIEAAGYQCEIDSVHSTFTAKSTGHQYMEGHHALPMKYQEMFSNSLDVYANIICLCPICHRLLHYGIETEKENVINKIYYYRSDRLAASGIKISKTDFVKLVI